MLTQYKSFVYNANIDGYWICRNNRTGGVILLFRIDFKGQLFEIFKDVSERSFGIVGDTSADDSHISEYFFSSDVHRDISNSHVSFINL